MPALPLEIWNSIKTGDKLFLRFGIERTVIKATLRHDARIVVRLEKSITPFISKGRLAYVYDDLRFDITAIERRFDNFKMVYKKPRE